MSKKTKKTNIILVTGAARSGKSEWAEMLAAKMETPVTYIATALSDESDPEWGARIAQHRLRRASHWHTLEVPINLSSIVRETAPPHCLLIDSLGTWVANCLSQDDSTWQETVTVFVTNLEQSLVDIILVAEETGWGVIPAYPSGRLFRDRLGNLIRQIGTIADIVYLITGGHVLNITQLSCGRVGS